MMLQAADIRESARGSWRATIYPSLGIVVGNGRHCPCPFCGGKDRFRCDDRDGSGSFFCNQCGAGDGFSLVMKVRGCKFPEALSIVAEVLGLSSSSYGYRPRLKAPRPRLDRRHLAFNFDLAALDLRLRAERIIEAGHRLNVASLTDEELDCALGHVMQAHADYERAELFEYMADTLRNRETEWRGHSDQLARIA